MPRTPWGRRRTTDSPRPAGRRWAGRLRRSGSLARQVLFVRVGRRRPVGTATALLHGTEAGSDAHSSHIVVGVPRPADRIVAPVSPALPLRSRSLPPAAPTASPATGPLSIPLLPGPHTPARVFRFALVNGCTLASLLLGMSAIFLSLQGDHRAAALCLVGSVTCDGLDGALARRLDVVSPFGAQMDSLADMCSFGIAAPVVVYASIKDSAPGLLVGMVCALIGACAAIRLARFNVSPKDGRFFCGVPTTMAAAVLGLATLIGLRLPGSIAVAAVAVLALAMVSSFPYAKLARIAKLPPWVWLAPVAGAVLDYRVTFAALVLLYLASGPLVWIHQKRA